jgi:hypothetical protein
VGGELRALRLLELSRGSTRLTLLSTFLGAHMTPEDVDSPRASMESVLGEMLRRVREEELAAFIDAPRGRRWVRENRLSTDTLGASRADPAAAQMVDARDLPARVRRASTEAGETPSRVYARAGAGRCWVGRHRAAAKRLRQLENGSSPACVRGFR